MPNGEWNQKIEWMSHDLCHPIKLLTFQVFIKVYTDWTVLVLNKDSENMAFRSSKKDFK